MVDIDKELINRLHSNAENLHWENEEGLSCCTVLFEDVEFMICKYNNGKGEKEVSFNQLDKDGYIVEPFNEYPKDHPFFEVLSKIFDIAWERKVYIAT